jgi:hypothetical protein
MRRRGVNRGPQSTGLPVEISVAAVGQILRQMLVLIAVPQRHAPEWRLVFTAVLLALRWFAAFGWRQSYGQERSR